MNETMIIRVLLADDHSVVRAGVRQFLEHAADIRVVAEAGDGEQARQLIAEHQPDVAVLDIQMPKASGIDVARWVRQNLRQTGVLILSAYDDDPFVLAALQAGANGYVLKTAAPAEIIRAVREVHAGRSALDPTVMKKVMARLSGTAAEGAQAPVETLSERELEVLRLAGRGHTNKAIGLQLNISDRTVQGHLARIFDKLQATSRTEAVMRAVSLGWLPPDLGEMREP